MKKYLSLLLMGVASLGFASVVNAKRIYNFEEITLSDKDHINSLLKVDNETWNIVGIGDHYSDGNDYDYSNTYYIGSEAGEVELANLRYISGFENYIFPEQGTISSGLHPLSGFKWGGSRFEEPTSHMAGFGGMDYPVDESLDYLAMYCPEQYGYNPDSIFLDHFSKPTDKNFVCATMAREEGSDENLYGLVMQGPEARVILEPSNEFEGVIVGDESVILVKKDNGGYVISSPDGVIGEFTDFLIDQVDDTFDEDVDIDIADISAVAYNNKLLFRVPVIISDTLYSSNRAVYVYDGHIVGKYSINGYAIKIKSGFVFIEDIPGAKAYNVDGSLLADIISPVGYCDNYPQKCEVITFIRDGQLIFFDGKEELYSKEYNANKDIFLPEYQFTSGTTMYFLAGDMKANGAREYVYTLEGPIAEVNDDDLILYKILEGKDQTFYKKAKKDIVIRSEGAYNKFWGVAIDGELVDEKNYTVAEGSTIVTLKADYLDTLKEGKYEVVLLFDDGYSETNLTVSTANPKTLDTVVITASVLVLSLVGVTTVCKRYKMYN